MNATTMPHPSDSVQPKALPRVVFVRQQFSPFGGGELILDRTISALTRRGARIALVGRKWTGRQDVEFIACDPPRFPRFLRERRFAEAACARLGAERNAIVQAHERIPCCDIFRAGDGVHAAYLAARARSMGALGRVAQRLSPFHRSVLALEKEMFASPRLKAVIVNSTMVADDIVRHYAYPRERIHLIANGIDLDRFTPAAREKHRIEVRLRFGVMPDQPVALFVGSGYGRKGLKSAIEAAARSEMHPQLWVVGHDRRPAVYRAHARRAGLRRLRVLGPVSDPLPYYAAADILILPAIYDPFPSTVIEALACGLPVVTSTGCGARDAVAKLDPALVRDAMDAKGLAEAIDRAFMLAAKPATVDAARAVASGYGVEPMVERLLALYDEVRARPA
jgi:UDP-glucose:(heptosyl)LPS alpha-1,3-glucosyltransferase